MLNKAGHIQCPTARPGQVNICAGQVIYVTCPEIYIEYIQGENYISEAFYRVSIYRTSGRI